ncbi:MAG: ATP phosphoribosyltransferase [Pirellulaceae bacterium]|nr:ATP phosphoribosyltransferase [Pirellulaceae bacterium]
MGNLRIGIPSKGRLAVQSEELLNLAGFKFRRQDRSLFAKVRDAKIEITFLRSDDIPVLCDEGAIDLGITGSDLVEEAGGDVLTRMKLGVGKCRLALCVAEDSPITSASDLESLRVATSFPNVTQNYLGKKGVQAHLVKLTGSVEVMISLGVADAIVDLVETGSTLVANRLRVIAEIGEHETVLIQNQKQDEPELADQVVRRLEGVIIARSYSLLEYNIPREKLSAAEEITPGFNSPTVSGLEDDNWCAVRVMVKRKKIIAAMEALESLGAAAILETKIENCRL